MVFQTALRSPSNRSKVVVGNYCISPITAEQYREKARPLRPRRSCFAPAEARKLWAWVEAPGTAPGSEWFIATAIYFHSRQAGTPQYSGQRLRKTVSDRAHTRQKRALNAGNDAELRWFPLLGRCKF